MKKQTNQGITKIGKRHFRIRVRAKDPRTGKLKEVDRIAEDIDLAEARRLREEWRAEIRAGANQEELERMTFRAYANGWLDGRLPRVKDSTSEWYASVLDLHVLPTFGDLYLDVITKRDIERWQKESSLQARPATANGWLAVVKMIMGEASVDYRFRDPSVRVKPLPTHDIEPRRFALTVLETSRLLTVVREQWPEHYPLLLLLTLTGMRWGEATALKWSDIDEEEGGIRVVKAHRRGRVSTTKTGRSRVYPLHEIFSEALKAHRGRLVAAQHPGLREGWVFAVRSARDKEKASLPTPKSWSKLLPKWLAAAEITKHITPHSLRRTDVDLLRLAKVDLVVRQSLVGHATVAMTDHYSTVATPEQREAMDKVVDLVFPSESGGSSGGSSPTNTESGPKAALK